MPLTSCTSMLVLILVSVLSQASFAQADGEELAIETDNEKLSYSIGVQFGRALEYSQDRIDLEILTRAIEDAMSGATLAMSNEEVAASLSEFQQIIQKDRVEALTAEGEAYLEDKAKEEGVVVLPSGLQYKIIWAGTGALPARTDTVETHYSGTFLDGKGFDSSYDRGEPATFAVNGVIRGWTEALQLMKVGAKWELYIPYNLAYGARGRQSIPPYSTLVFEIELLRIVE